MKKLVGLLALAAGCAGAWVETKERYQPASGDYSVQLPPGWMRITTARELAATRDGIRLQRIHSHSHPFGAALKGARRAVAQGMLPEEAAEVIRDELAVDGAASGVTFDENGPATLGARPGFRIAYRYRTGDGLRMRGLVYGVIGDGGLFTLGYEAPERYYFEHDAQAFEQVRASFELRPAR